MLELVRLGMEWTFVDRQSSDLTQPEISHTIGPWPGLALLPTPLALVEAFSF